MSAAPLSRAGRARGSVLTCTGPVATRSLIHGQPSAPENGVEFSAPAETNLRQARLGIIPGASCAIRRNARPWLHSAAAARAPALDLFRPSDGLRAARALCRVVQPAASRAGGPRPAAGREGSPSARLRPPRLPMTGSACMCVCVCVCARAPTG